MPAGHVQVAPDSTGKDIDAVSITSSEVGSPTVYRQVVVLGDPTTYGSQAAITALGALKVDGSAVTQPVSGTVAVSNFPATQPVSGTVSVDLTATGTNTNPILVEATILTAPLDVQQSGGTPWGVTQSTTPWVVSGTFFQTTQPVSLTGEGLESLRTQRMALGRSILRPRMDKLRRVGLHA